MRCGVISVHTSPASRERARDVERCFLRQKPKMNTVKDYVKKISALLILLIFFIAHVDVNAVRADTSGPIVAVTDKGRATENRKLQREQAVGVSSPLRPSPLTPSDETAISDSNVDFSWKAPSGRHSFRLQVSSRPSFNPAILDAVTASPSYGARTAFAPGTYYWRVRTINAFRKSGPWSKVREFRILDVPPPNTMIHDFINQGAPSTDSTLISLALSAASRVGISAYRISESPDQPGAADPGWVKVTSSSLFSSTIPYTLSNGDGPKTIFVWFKDAAGRISSAATGTIILDTGPPIATITSRPSGTSDSDKAVFGFSASKPESAFRCKLDSGDYTVCSSPRAYDRLSPREHTFSVKAVDGKRESQPSSYTWVIIPPLDNATEPNFVNKGSAIITIKKTVTLSLSAKANMDRKIAGYFASESPDTPDASDPGWTTFPPVKEYSGKVSFTLSDGSGAKRIYVWFKDTDGNVSAVKSGKITYWGSKYLVILFLIIQAALIAG